MVVKNEVHTPSRDKASRMLRQAVARSAMDCHSSSVESVVSERTERTRSSLFVCVHLCLKEENTLSFVHTLENTVYLKSNTYKLHNKQVSTTSVCGKCPSYI